MKANVFPLTDNFRTLLSKMNFGHDLPEEAKYIAFFEDGDAQLLEDFKVGFETIAKAKPVFISAYYDVELIVE